MSFTSKIGLGTVQFGVDYGVSNTTGKTSKEEVSKILNYAQKNDVNVLDTASAYGNAEEILGENNLKQFNVVSKFLLAEDRKPIEDQLTESLRKLKLSSIYGYLAHRPLNVIENKIVWEFLEKSKEEGIIKKIGFSFNEVSELVKVIEAGFIPDLIQVPYNYFDQRFKSYMIDLKSKGCEIHTRSTFLQGLFFCNPNELDSYFDKVKDKIQSLQNEYKNELSSVLLKYVLSKPFIDSVIIGVENKEQLKINIEGIENDYEIQENNFEVSEDILIPSNWPK